MGEDIAEMGGSMGVTHGMVEEFGPERVRNTPISEMALAGAAIGAAVQGMRPVAEIMYEDFMTLAAEQIVNQAAKHRYMSGGQVQRPGRLPHAGRRGLVSRGTACAAARSVVRAHSGAEGRLRLDARGRARAALVGDLRRQSRRLLRAPHAVRDQGQRAGGDRADPDRQGARAPRGRGRHGDRDRAGSSTNRSRPPRKRRRRESRSRSSTRARCSRSTRKRSSPR